MDRFGGMTVTGLLDAYAAANPTPGGGTASAMAGAAGAALLEMACAVALKKASGADAERLTRIVPRAQQLRAQLLQAMTDDSAAFEGIRGAAKAVKEGNLPGDEARRVRADATRTASGVPLSVARACREGAELARTVLRHTRPATRSDVAVAAALFRAAAFGAACNVAINLDSTLSAAERSALRRGAVGARAGAEHAGRAVTRRVSRGLGISGR